MSDHKTTIYQMRMVQSDESLKSALILIEAGDARGAMNRIYYACFYSVIAQLVLADIKAYTHSGVSTMFNRHFIKNNLIDKELGRTYSKIFNYRILGDYQEILEFDLQTVKELLIEASNFISVLNNINTTY